MSKRLDISGKRFGRLTVIAPTHSLKHKWYWLCKCDCGKVVTVASNSLQYGRTNSCGCLQLETAVAKNVTHGHACKSNITPEYRAWISMKHRCNNPKNAHYKDYGGRGVRVCDRWLTSFENFLEDLGRRPSAQHSLDRFPDVNGNYEPGNIRWATDSQQSKNKRSNKKIVYQGREMAVSEFIKALGLEGQHSTIYYQLTRRTPDEVAALFKTKS